MNEEFARLAARIRTELPEIERLGGRLREGWERAIRTGDELYLDGVALNLHGFYGALERLFERIASAVEAKPPDGANWHQVLLEQMTKEAPHIRPAVISLSVKESLDEFRGFRHVARNIYTFNIDRTSPQCRKVITGRDWRLPELQARYAGWFCWHVQRRIDGLDVGE